MKSQNLLQKGGMSQTVKQQIYVAMPMYNLIEYSNDYSDTSGSLWQFKRDEVPTNNVDLTINDSQSFKYKAAL